MAKQNWIGKAVKNAKRFADAYRLQYVLPDRQLSALFEIACFHALVDFYADVLEVVPQNLNGTSFRYLTSPSGNPANFSYVDVVSPDETFQIRQQVRIRSHVHDDITFTPDIVVLRQHAVVTAITDALYAGGKRRFLFVSARDVVAAHECKSLNPFPELMVSFLGMYFAAHPWIEQASDIRQDENGPHLAPTLFVGGTARGIHMKMIPALSQAYGINVITGMHRGSWNLFESKTLRRLSVAVAPPSSPVDEQMSATP